MDTSEPAPVSAPQPTEPATPPPAAPETESPAPAPTPRRSPLARLKQLSRRQVLLLGVAGILVLAGIGGSVWALSYYHTTPTKPTSHTTTSTTTSSSTDATTPTTTDDSLKATRTINGITFLASVKKLDNLHLFTNYDSFFSNTCLDDKCTQQEPSVTDNNVTYYQVGTTQDGQALLDVQVVDSNADPIAGGATESFFVLQTSSSAYTLLAIPSGLNTRTVPELQKTLAATVTIDTDSAVAALNFPDTLAVTNSAGNTANLSVLGSAAVPTLAPSGLSTVTAYNGKTYPTTTFGTSGDYTAYEINQSTTAGYNFTTWYVGFKNMFVVSYNLKDSFLPAKYGDNVAISWTSGQNNASVYGDSAEAVAGCGAAGAYLNLPSGTTASSLTKVGTGPKDQAIYVLATDSAAFQAYYARASAVYSSENTGKTLSVADFQSEHGVIAVQNDAGEFAVYGRSDLAPAGGCGEPVVYLYPQQSTYVDVSVGAKVVKSDPFYPATTGWQDVLAQPDGQLRYQGKSYSSLLWEGYGYGQYPAVTSGTVVPGNQAAATVRAEMKELGFLPNEINDFMAFWGPKLPHTPYVRLTWFGTNQVQALAPLTVWPRPNTVLRAFLDFQGLQQPISIPAQQLTGTPRRGFTVVEWGGLLRDGIN